MRTGKKNQPFFRFVVTEKKNSSTAGRTTEILGFYNPLTKERQINKERAKYWLSVGAKPSDTVFNFFVIEKLIDAKKIPQHKKSKKAQAVQKPVETAPAAAPVVVEEKKAAEGDPYLGREETAIEATTAEPVAETAEEAAKPEEQPASE